MPDIQVAIVSAKSIGVVAALPSSSLVIFTRDDIRLDPPAIAAYRRAARRNGPGSYFGGPFDVRYEALPPRGLRGVLPRSMTGWTPKGVFDPEADSLASCNWAAFAGDLVRSGVVGGGPIRSETDLRTRMRAVGLVPRYVPGARAVRVVRRDEVAVETALRMAHQIGYRRGEKRREGSIIEIARYHWSHLVRLLVVGIAVGFSRLFPASGFHLRARYRWQLTLGYFAAFRDPGRLMVQNAGLHESPQVPPVSVNEISPTFASKIRRRAA